MNVLKVVESWSRQRSRKDSVLVLIQAGLSPRAAEQMTIGKYRHRIRQSTIEKLKKAGVI